MDRFVRSTPGLVMAWSTTVGAQSTLALNNFVPGGQELVLLDFATFPLGAPAALGGVTGQLDIVVHDGARMLRASARSSFLVKLPTVLPNDFTLEFNLIPKTCCNPEDLAFEGTPEITQSDVSANVLWHRDHVQIVGGGPTFDRPMPSALSATLPGSPTYVAVSMSGTTMRIFTNGQLVYTVDRQFVRNRVLRVFLGGQNDTDQAVYLAQMRIATGAPIVSTPASGPSTVAPPASAGAVGGIPRTAAAPNTSGQAAATLPPSALTQANNPLTSPIPPITATNASNPSGTQQTVGGTAMLASPPVLLAGPRDVQVVDMSSPTLRGGWGVIVHWLPLPNATSYRVTRTETNYNLFSQSYGASTTSVIQPIPIPSNLTTPGRVVIVDPFVQPGLAYTYWVEGVVGGSLTAPSTIAQLGINQPQISFASLFGFAPPLTYTVGGTRPVWIPGTPPLVTTPGSDVTWTWIPLQGFLLYEASHEILDAGKNVVSFERFTMYIPLDGSSLPPIVKSVPKGQSGRLCISYYATQPMAPLPADKVCGQVQVP